MPKYVHVIVVDAWQFTAQVRDQRTLTDWPSWVLQAVLLQWEPPPPPPPKGLVTISTMATEIREPGWSTYFSSSVGVLGKDMRKLKVGDWLTRGKDGVIKVMSADEFFATFKPGTRVITADLE